MQYLRTFITFITVAIGKECFRYFVLSNYSVSSKLIRSYLSRVKRVIYRVKFMVLAFIAIIESTFYEIDSRFIILFQYLEIQFVFIKLSNNRFQILIAIKLRI